VTRKKIWTCGESSANQVSHHEAFDHRRCSRGEVLESKVAFDEFADAHPQESVKSLKGEEVELHTDELNKERCPARVRAFFASGWQEEREN
jgi:hypothetical protein